VIFYSGLGDTLPAIHELLIHTPEEKNSCSSIEISYVIV